MKIKQGVSVFSFVFIGLAIIALVVMGALYARLKWIQSEMDAVEGTIISITQTVNDDFVVIIEYVYDDLVYTTHSSIYDSSMNEEDKIIIYVDPSNPEKIYQPDFFFFVIFPGIFASVFGVIGIVGLYSGLKFKTIKSQFMSSGKKIVATITDIHINHNNRLTVGSKVSYRSQITCKFIDEFTGIEQIFKSSRFWLPAGHGLQNGVTKVHVYVDKTDSKKYFIDIESLNSNL